MFIRYSTLMVHPNVRSLIGAVFTSLSEIEQALNPKIRYWEKWNSQTKSRRDCVLRLRLLPRQRLVHVTLLDIRRNRRPGSRLIHFLLCMLLYVPHTRPKVDPARTDTCVLCCRCGRDHIKQVRSHKYMFANIHYRPFQTTMLRSLQFLAGTSRRCVVLHRGSTTLKPDTLRLLHTTLSRWLPLNPIYLSDPGEGISEVELIKWHVNEGSSINEFDPLCEVQSDKASVEITSRHQGTVSSLKWKVGQIVKVGEILCEVQSQQQQQEEASDSIPLQPEESAAQDEDRYAQPGPSAAAATPSEPNASPPEHIRSLAVPSVRRLCREHNLQVTDIRGSGKDGRVMKEDVLKYLDSQKQTAQAPSQEDPELNLTSESAVPDMKTTVPLTGIRKAMFKSLSQSTSIPHFTFSEEIDITDLEAARVALNEYLSNQDPSASSARKVTILSYLVKALSMSINSNPIFTHRLTIPDSSASITEQASQALLHSQSNHDISIAYSTSNGLLTPTLSSINRKSILEIASEIKTLQSSNGNLTKQQLGNGGLITLSNIGSIGGGIAASPILPPTGQLAIGAVCKADWKPRYVGKDKDVLQRRLILPVTFAGDHRVLQGTELAKLVCDWKRLLEQPGIWSAQMT